jgi:hypothetical protein
MSNSSERHFIQSVFPGPTYVSQLRTIHERLNQYYPATPVNGTIVFGIIKSAVEFGVAQIIPLNRLTSMHPIWIRFPEGTMDNKWLSFVDGKRFTTIAELLIHMKTYLWPNIKRLLPFAALTISSNCQFQSGIMNEIELQNVQNPLHALCGFDNMIHTPEQAELKASQLPSNSSHLLWYDRKQSTLLWRTAQRTSELPLLVQGYCVTRIGLNLRIYQTFSTTPVTEHVNESSPRILPKTEPSVIPPQAIIDSMFGMCSNEKEPVLIIMKPQLIKFRLQAQQATGHYMIYALLLPEEIVYLLHVIFDRENREWRLLHAATRERSLPNGPSLHLKMIHYTCFTSVQDLIRFNCASHLSLHQIIQC